MTHNSVKTTVIQSLKCHFCKLVLLRMTECIDKKEVYSVKLLDAVRFVHKAWERITEIECSFTTTEEEDDLPFSEWVRRIDSVNFAFCSLDGFSSVDDDILTTETLTAEDIVKEVKINKTVHLMKRI